MRLKVIRLDALPQIDSVAGWARHSGICEATLVRYIRGGALVARRIGRYLVIEKSEFLRWSGLAEELKK